ncbi:response regulator transcription factor [Bifidobacterium callitrichos]|uniref:LuxR family two component transcriptional regulator n=1 Tax=Bifidobacterium callitrichos DSM 23973 TaxID=1437609 RepID=A0A087A2Z7_9BIFI|nr:response regulator transcription factor [Bifidobacterium callitrichos]KFI53147.1 LuxR family two component transcriptional regulator [Bifidobacterium callitrichos DSM 23973]
MEHKRNTLLIVDNDHITLMALHSFLSKALPDFDLLPPADGGDKAIQRCTGAFDPPQVLLIDMSMSGINGPMAIRAIRRENRDIRMLAMTSFTLEDYAREAAEAGAQGIISKNDVQHMADALQAVADDRLWDGGAKVAFDDAATAYKRVKAERKNDLSAREIEAVNAWCRGMTAARIAESMDVSENTVRTYLARASEKLGCASRKELISTWLRLRSR